MDANKRGLHKILSIGIVVYPQPNMLHDYRCSSVFPFRITRLCVLCVSVVKNYSFQISHFILVNNYDYFYFVTKLTSRPGTTIVLTTCFDFKSSATRSSERAAASIAARSALAGTVTRPRTFPLI